MKIIFLDRDGVINKFPGKNLYVTRMDDFHLIPSSIKAIALLSQSGYDVYVISNQGCISRGMITEAALQEITDKMTKAVEGSGGRIAGVYYCPHQTSDQCDCKKPKVGLFKKALAGKEGKVDLSSVYFVGDSEEDMQAGKNLGCKTILVTSGRIAKGEVGALNAQPDIVKKNLWEAANWIIQKKF